MQKLKVFLDSNVVFVIFSAAYSEKEKSRSYLFFELQNLNIIKIYISNLVKFESVRNFLSYNFFKKVGINNLTENIFCATFIIIIDI